MSNSLLDDLKLIDPLPAQTGDPPALADLLGRVDTSVRPFSQRLDPAPVRRRALLGRRPAFAAAAVLGASLVAALALSDLGGERLDVAAAAYRATQQGTGVLHMSIVSERTVGASTRTTSEDIWTAQNPRRIRTVHRDSEETLEGALTTAPVQALTWSSSQPDVIKRSVPEGVELKESSPVQTIHQLLGEGRATVVGKTTYAGHEAWELQIHPVTPAGSFEDRQLPAPVLIVASGSYVPLEFVEHYVTSENGKPELAQQRERFVVYAELPANAQDESLLKLASHAGARVQSEG
jgi:hypothetical protein